MISEKDFVNEHEHEMLGWVLDALTCGLTGPLASKRIREWSLKVRERLRRIYAELKPPVETNGQAGPAINRPAVKP